MRIEETILSQLVYNETYARKVVPFIEFEYFGDKVERVLATETVDFFNKYNTLITPEALRVQVSNRSDLSDSELVDAINKVEGLAPSDTNINWLVENTEKFCKEKSLYNAILRSIKIIDGKDKNLNAEAIPSLLQEALAVSFDTNVGHSYTDDAESRYDFYTRVEERLAFDIELLNKVTKGGLPRKSLSMVVAECVHPDTKVKLRLRRRSST